MKTIKTFLLLKVQKRIPKNKSLSLIKAVNLKRINIILIIIKIKN